MDDSRAKLAGPAIAVGAVSLGLIIIGACGVGQQDVYVPPPPLAANLAAAPSRIADDDSTSTTTRVPIPPSPTWRIAPYMSPRKPFSLSSTETSPSEPPAEGETTSGSRPSETTTESRSPEPTTESRAPETTTEDRTTTTPSRTTRPVPVPTLTTRPTVEDEEAAETDDPTTHAHDRATSPTPTGVDTAVTPTPAHTTETTTTPPTTTDEG
ncbi:hypothetical protein [Nocardia asteroides]|uniref:hypothetical protein n=1 Tax=Nocardia asteroides TaxID=1824 RepID=UPI00342E68F0